MSAAQLGRFERDGYLLIEGVLEPATVVEPLFAEYATVLDRLAHERVRDLVECLVGSEIYSNPVQHVRIKPPEYRLPEGAADVLVRANPWHQDNGVVSWRAAGATRQRAARPGGLGRALEGGSGAACRRSRSEAESPLARYRVRVRVAGAGCITCRDPLHPEARPQGS